jgi:hypothetical protein
MHSAGSIESSALVTPWFRIEIPADENRATDRRLGPPALSRATDMPTELVTAFPNRRPLSLRRGPPPARWEDQCVPDLSTSQGGYASTQPKWRVGDARSVRRSTRRIFATVIRPHTSPYRSRSESDAWKRPQSIATSRVRSRLSSASASATTNIALLPRSLAFSPPDGSLSALHRPRLRSSQSMPGRDNSNRQTRLEPR